MGQSVETLKSKVRALEKRNAFLEETLAAVDDFKLSEDARRFIESRRYAMAVAGLINSTSDSCLLDLSAEERDLKKMEIAKAEADARIEEIVAATARLSGTDEELSSLFSYAEVGGGIEITSYNGFDIERVVVPECIAGKKVVCIGDAAFRGLDIEEVVLPPTVKRVESRAFFECKRLRSVVLPSKLETIGFSAFASTALRSLAIPSGTKVLRGRCFMNCTCLARVVIPSSVDYIGSSTFEFCLSLRDVLIEEGTGVIGKRAFYNCPISSIVLPETLYYIGQDSFGVDETASSLKQHPIHIAVLGDAVDITCYCDEDNCGRYDVNLCEGEDGMLLPWGRDCLNHVEEIISSSLPENAIIYCKPGAAIQKPARRRGLEVKPLSHFQNREKQQPGELSPEDTDSIESIIESGSDLGLEYSTEHGARTMNDPMPRIIYKDEYCTVTGFCIEIMQGLCPGIACIFENNTDEYLDDLSYDARFFDNNGRYIGQSFGTVDFVGPHETANLDFIPLSVDLRDEKKWTQEDVEQIRSISLSPFAGNEYR